MDKIKMPTLQEAMKGENLEIKDIELTIVSGNRIQKSELRQKLNIATRIEFRNDIMALCNGHKEFKQKWEKFKRSKYLSVELSNFYCQHIFPERKVVLK